MYQYFTNNSCELDSKQCNNHEHVWMAFVL